MTTQEDTAVSHILWSGNLAKWRPIQTGRAGSASAPSGSAAAHAGSWFPSNSFKFSKSSNYVMVLEFTTTSCGWSAKKRHETRVSAEKKYRKKFARSTACRRYLTRLSRKKDGALLALLRRSRLTSGCPWGAGTVSFVVSGRNREFFVA